MSVGGFHRALRAKGVGAKDWSNSWTEHEYLGVDEEGKHQFVANFSVGHRVFKDKADGLWKKHKVTDERPAKDCVVVQSAQCCVEVYPFYAKYFDVDYEEVRLYEERWVVQRLFKEPDKWRDVGAYNPVMSVEEAGDFILVTVVYQTDYGKLTVRYFQRDGNNLAHHILFVNESGETEIFRVLQCWSGIVGAKCNGKNIPFDIDTPEEASYLAFHSIDKSKKKFNIINNLRSTIFNPDGSKKIGKCLQLPLKLEVHAQGMKADFIFEEWTLAPTESLRMGCIETLRPSANGDHIGLLQDPPSGSNYDKVDEVIPDGEGTVVYRIGGVDENYDLYKLPDHTEGSGTINSVTVYCRGACNATPGWMKAKIKTHNTEYEGNTWDLPHLSGGFTTFSHVWEKNPNTDIPWTWDEIDNLQIGVWLKGPSSGYYPQCTQVCVVVEYGEHDCPDTATLDDPTEDGNLTKMGTTVEICSGVMTYPGRYTTGDVIGFGGYPSSPNTYALKGYVEWLIISLFGGTLTANPVFKYEGLMKQDTDGEIVSITDERPRDCADLDLWNYIAAGVAYVDPFNLVAGANQSQDLGGTAKTDLQAAMDARQSWFAIGIQSPADECPEVEGVDYGDSYLRSEEFPGTPPPTLYVEYTPPPGWTGKISGVVNPAKIMGVAVADIAKVKGVA